MQFSHQAWMISASLMQGCVEYSIKTSCIILLIVTIFSDQEVGNP